MSTEKSSKTPVVAVIVAVILIAVGGLFFLSNNGVAESKKEPASGTPAAAAGGDQAAAAEGDQPSIKLGNPVVAVVDGEEVKRSDVFNFISNLPEQVRQMPIQTLFPLALDQVVNNKIIGKKAEGAKLEGDPEVEQLLVQAKGNIIRNVFVERKVGEQITQKKLLKEYEDALTKMGDVQEIHARHILVDSEDKAKEVVAKLDGGAKFDDLAKEMSTGPSKDNGGDLGYFAQNEMVPEFANAAFAVNVGEYTKAPVKTQFGWHVIKVEDKRKRPEPEFEAVKPQLEQQLRQKTLANLLQDWQKDAKIKKFDINGEAVKEGKK